MNEAAHLAARTPLASKAYGYKNTARIVGILYIIGTFAGVLSVPFLKIRNEPDYLTRIAENPNLLITGALLVLIMAFALALIPMFMFPVLRKYSEPAGIGYVIFRGALETGTYIISVICYLELASLAVLAATGTSDSAHFLAIGTTLNTIADLPVGAFVFGIGALIFYIALYRYRLIPRWLSALGLIAVLLHIASGALVLFGLQEAFDTGSLSMNLPIALQEMVMAVWLIIKGFQISEAD